ncbi:MAG TPA: DNA repair protein RecO [Gemmatimonadales bacterium]
MAALQSEAIVLSAIRYGETSKIVRLATRDRGIVSAIAKGALRPRSRFGAALQLLSRGTAQYLPPRHGELHTLTAFDLQHLPLAVGAALERFAAAIAMAELVQRVGSADPHPEIFDALDQAIRELEHASPEAAEVLGLKWLWSIVCLLGFEPALAGCALDGTLIPNGVPMAFSVSEGGALCPDCARSRAANWLPAEDRADLTVLLDPDAALPRLDPRHATAHRRLLARFIHHQVAEGANLPALDFWLREPWGQG